MAESQYSADSAFNPDPLLMTADVAPAGLATTWPQGPAAGTALPASPVIATISHS